MSTKLLEIKKVLNEFNGFMNRVSRVYSCITGVDKYELFGEANTALLKAVTDFDKTRSDSFGTYAKYIIVDALNEYIRQNKVIVSIPRYIARANLIIGRIKKLVEYNDAKFYALYTEKDTPTSTELKHQLKLLKNAAERAKTTIPGLVERSEFLPTTTDSNSCMFTEVYNESDVQKKMLAKLFVQQVCENLNKTERIVVDHLMEGMSINEISTVLDIPYNRVSKIVVEIRKKVLTLLED
jgi:RNA polymerase sigma factor (sigma-70 family)